MAQFDRWDDGSLAEECHPHRHQFVGNLSLLLTAPIGEDLLASDDDDDGGINDLHSIHHTMSSNVRRIHKELAEVHNSTGLQAIRVETDDENVLFWKASIQGPDSSPYQSGVFDLSISFPADYPFKAPLIKFTTRIYHPNVDDEGNICVGLLKQESWKPATKMATVLLSIYNLLLEPNPDDPLVASVAELYKTNRKEFDANARAYVQKYAIRK